MDKIGDYKLSEKNTPLFENMNFQVDPVSGFRGFDLKTLGGVSDLLGSFDIQNNKITIDPILEDWAAGNIEAIVKGLAEKNGINVSDVTVDESSLRPKVTTARQLFQRLTVIHMSLESVLSLTH